MDSETQVFQHYLGVVLNNWTGLRMAVEHGMGGHHTKTKLDKLIELITNFVFTKNTSDWECLADQLEDVMDEDFNTLLEDNSVDQVAQEICSMYHLLKADPKSCEFKMNSLPVQSSIVQQNHQRVAVVESSDESEEDEESAGPEGASTSAEDMEWTVVTRKKK